MKPYVNLLIFVFAAIALYTAYGLFTFQVDEPRQFVFNEPKMPDNLKKTDEVISEAPKVGPLAAEKTQSAISSYQNSLKNAPQQANDTLVLLLERMSKYDLPSYFLSAPNIQKNGIRTFETLKINTDNAIDPATLTTKPNLNCSSRTPAASIIIGTQDKDTISCDTKRDIAGQNGDTDFMLIGGPENDQITDAIGNRIVNGGTGDDLITLEAGRSIIVLDASWGKDTLKVDCSGAYINQNEIPQGFEIPWTSKTTNFIVLGNTINPADVEWRDNVLTHKVTGDALTVNENCFTVVPALPAPPVTNTPVTP